MRLETERLIVRDLAATDLDAVHAILDGDPGTGSCSRAERARWLEWTILGYQEQERLHQPPYGDRGVVLRATGEVNGLVGLVPCLMPFGLLPFYGETCSTNRHPYNVAEMGLFWTVAAAHRRMGYAVEAATALIGVAFTQWHVRRIVATTEFTNTASIGVMRRLGMRVDRNPQPAPFFLQAVGILDNTGAAPSWPTA
jgi:RimJ/RimL family protein N-acetyltransferase